MIRRRVLNLVEASLLISVLLILLLALSGPAHAQDRSVVGERFDVSLTVHENGDVDVVEIRTIQFKGGPFRFGFRTIPYGRLEGVTNVAFFEGDRRYKLSSSEEPYTYQTSVDGSGFTLRWFFPELSNATRTFTLKYTAKGAIRIYEDGDQLWWTAVEGDRGYPVRASEVTVYLPEGVDEIQMWDSYGVRAQAEIVDARTVVFRTEETIGPGESFDVRVQFPHGVVQAPPPAWQKDFDAQVAEREAQPPSGVDAADPYAELVNLLAGFIGLFVAVGGTVGLFILWYTRGRDAPVPMVAEYLPQPPGDLPPGVVGTLLDETADMQDIIATIVDLARRGVITMQEVKEQGFLGIGARRDFLFEKQDHQETLRPYEKTLLEELFGGRQSRKLSSLKEKFYAVIPALQEELYEEVVREDFFRRSPHSTRRIYAILGSVGVGLSILLGFFSLVVLVPFAPAGVCIPFGFGVVSLGLLIFSRVMPRKTTKGSEAAARWRAFKRYLENIEDHTDLEQAKDIFDKYLAYAIAFGLEKSWVQKFARVDAPAPPWYMPAGPVWGAPWPHGPGRRVHRRGGRPVVVGTSGGRGGSASAPDMGERGGGMPDLQRTSDSLGRGLQSMSDGLATMLTTAGSILASAPRSSGNGGGWSGGGGGFSGGGFSGGGSGGGSSGFG